MQSDASGDWIQLASTRWRSDTVDAVLNAKERRASNRHIDINAEQ